MLWVYRPNLTKKSKDKDPDPFPVLIPVSEPLAVESPVEKIKSVQEMHLPPKTNITEDKRNEYIEIKEEVNTKPVPISKRDILDDTDPSATSEV